MLCSCSVLYTLSYFNSYFYFTPNRNTYTNVLRCLLLREQPFVCFGLISTRFTRSPPALATSLSPFL